METCDGCGKKITAAQRLIEDPKWRLRFHQECRSAAYWTVSWRMTPDEFRQHFPDFPFQISSDAPHVPIGMLGKRPGKKTKIVFKGKATCMCGSTTYDFSDPKVNTNACGLCDTGPTLNTETFPQRAKVSAKPVKEKDVSLCAKCQKRPWQASLKYKGKTFWYCEPCYDAILEAQRLRKKELKRQAKELLKKVPEAIQAAYKGQKPSFVIDMVQRYLKLDEKAQQDFLDFFESDGPTMWVEAKQKIEEGTPTSADLTKQFEQEVRDGKSSVIFVPCPLCKAMVPRDSVVGGTCERCLNRAGAVKPDPQREERIDAVRGRLYSQLEQLVGQKNTPELRAQMEKTLQEALREMCVPEKTSPGSGERISTEELERRIRAGERRHGLLAALESWGDFLNEFSISDDAKAYFEAAIGAKIEEAEAVESVTDWSRCPDCRAFIAVGKEPKLNEHTYCKACDLPLVVRKDKITHDPHLGKTTPDYESYPCVMISGEMHAFIVFTDAVDEGRCSCGWPDGENLRGSSFEWQGHLQKTVNAVAERARSGEQHSLMIITGNEHAITTAENLTKFIRKAMEKVEKDQVEKPKSRGCGPGLDPAEAEMAFPMRTITFPEKPKVEHVFIQEPSSLISGRCSCAKWPSKTDPPFTVAPTFTRWKLHVFESALSPDDMAPKTQFYGIPRWLPDVAIEELLAKQKTAPRAALAVGVCRACRSSVLFEDPGKLRCIKCGDAEAADVEFRQGVVPVPTEILPNDPGAPGEAEKASPKDDKPGDCERSQTKTQTTTETVFTSGLVTVPMILWCPACGASHVDEGTWATKPHRTHRCHVCAYDFRPCPIATVGVVEVPESFRCPEHPDQGLLPSMGKARVAFGADATKVNLRQSYPWVLRCPVCVFQKPVPPLEETKS